MNETQMTEQITVKIIGISVLMLAIFFKDRILSIHIAYPKLK